MEFCGPMLMLELATWIFWGHGTSAGGGLVGVAARKVGEKFSHTRVRRKAMMVVFGDDFMVTVEWFRWWRRRRTCG